ncbi:Serine/threonine-protein phosphatase 2A regulatory subunit B [Piromyces finnis]|uniref:Serine/threonine-protein phosphatase 2A regulatory subunit B n=1 Tax=Piromyces finnis TaxID=1754191 RepID=A0A1Y1VNZ3_9FUNG|nr:Serine/threonine-protein phosphatase 2A regulatory subunit B [Piromyces finnis]|eukprot:ORX61127.1 Serine/threonine-protein phosphatase 2A regulatory subunit B [Piromyces finnis]
MSWATALKEIVDDENVKELYKSEEAIEQEYFKELMGYNNSSIKNNYKIPQFFFKKKKNTKIQNQLQKASYYSVHTEVNNNLLSEDDLDELWIALCESSNNHDTQVYKKLSYFDFTAIAAALPTKFKEYFSSKIFYQLMDDTGYISVINFFNYVVKKISFKQTRLDLSLYDTDNTGYLTEEQFEDYLTDLIKSLPQIFEMNKMFEKFYVCIAARKFFFFLDPRHKGKINIRELLLSSVYQEFYGLKENKDDKYNWFSIESAMTVYGQYLNLDTDGNGMISRSELSNFCSGVYSDIFLDRVFEEFPTYNNEMDFQAFIDFHLMVNNLNKPEAISLAFRCLDLEGVGYLSKPVVTHHYKSLFQKMVKYGFEIIEEENIVVELFDMAHPEETEKIKIQDLIKCGMANSILGILIDARGLNNYENRE